MSEQLYNVSALYSAPNFTGRIPSLDGLRAVSILLVLVGHVSLSDGAPHALKLFNHVGNIGVRFFFVISGFLITTLLLKEKSRTGAISMKKFYQRRTLRIFPAAYVFITVIGLLASVGWIAVRRGELFYAASFTMNYHDFHAVWLGQLWSLAVEEQFYLLWPGLVLLAGAKRAVHTAGVVIVVAPLLRACMWYWWGASDTAMTKHFEAVADALATGCVLSASYNRLGASAIYIRLQAKTLLFLLTSVTLILFGNALYLFRPSAFYVWGQSIANIGTVLCIDWAIRNRQHSIGRLLNGRLAVAVGVLSYSLYLWQNPFLLGDKNNVWTTFPQNLIFTFASAVLCYFAIERPFLRIKNVLERQKFSEV